VATAVMPVVVVSAALKVESLIQVLMVTVAWVVTVVMVVVVTAAPTV